TGPVTKPISGSANARAIDATQPGSGRQSSSVNASTAPSARAAAALRARDVPGSAQRMTVAPAAAATSLTDASRDAESATTLASPGRSASRTASSAPASSGARSRQAMTTVTQGADVRSSVNAGARGVGLAALAVVGRR